jgi:hypothetical protein
MSVYPEVNGPALNLDPEVDSTSPAAHALQADRAFSGSAGVLTVYALRTASRERRRPADSRVSCFTTSDYFSLSAPGLFGGNAAIALRLLPARRRRSRGDHEGVIAPICTIRTNKYAALAALAVVAGLIWLKGVAQRIARLRPCAPDGHRQGEWPRRLARLHRLSPLSRPSLHALAGQ